MLLSTGRGAHTFLYGVMSDGRSAIIEPMEADESQTPQQIHILVAQNCLAEFRDRQQHDLMLAENLPVAPR